MLKRTMTVEDNAGITLYSFTEVMKLVGKQIKGAEENGFTFCISLSTSAGNQRIRRAILQQKLPVTIKMRPQARDMAVNNRKARRKFQAELRSLNKRR